MFTCGGGRSVRLLLALLAFLGTLSNYLLRVNINIAIISMTNNATDLCANATSSSDSTPAADDGGGGKIFCWTQTEKSLVLGAFYVGYMVLQVPGGGLAEKFGTKRVLGYSTVVTTGLALLTPMAAALHVWALVLLRAVQGLTQGVLFPSLLPLIMRWVPEQEKGRYLSFTFTGGSVGSLVAYPMCGIILKYLNWQAVFYITGALASIWCVLWILLVTDLPEDHPRISRDEKEYIIKHRTKVPLNKRRSLPPYLAMLKNPGIQVLLLCNFASDWGLYTQLTEGPTFIKEVMGQDIATNGFLSSLPHLCRFTMGLSFATLMDMLLKHKIVRKPVIRRIMTIIGLGMPAVSLGMLGFFTDDITATILIMAVGFGFHGAVDGGFMQTPMDIAPDYSGTAFGFSNGLGSVSGFITPFVVTLFTEEDPTDPVGWRYVFLIAMALYILAAITYAVFGRFTPQNYRQKPDNIGSCAKNNLEEGST